MLRMLNIRNILLSLVNVAATEARVISIVCVCFAVPRIAGHFSESFEFLHTFRIVPFLYIQS